MVEPTRCQLEQMAVQRTSKPAGQNPSYVHEERNVTRRILAQLRSGYSPFLQIYLHRLDETTSEACLQCNSETHTTGHLFRCSANPTTLTPTHCGKTQWRQPLSHNSRRKKPQRQTKGGSNYEHLGNDNNNKLN